MFSPITTATVYWQAYQKVSLIYCSQFSNASAKLLCGCQKYHHVTPLIRDRLHWLPVPQRIEFKLCLFGFQITSWNGTPRYLADLCCSTTAETGYNLRSATHGDLRVRKMCTKFGDRAFSVTGLRAWNKASNGHSIL